MVDVSATATIAMPAEAVWEVIGEFGGLQKWATVVKDCTVADTPRGRVRTFTMGDDATIEEVLLTSSQFSYTYGFVNRPATPDYRSTVAVVPLATDTCAIFLSVQMSPTEELTEAALNERYEKFLGGNLKAMKRALGVPRE